ncbi:MAG TPA: CsgG/HfaB family protein [Fibrobacteria bacterium]|nr:CsgG/HfaB family protein [Fibrobacteria bacterium]
MFHRLPSSGRVPVHSGALVLVLFALPPAMAQVVAKIPTVAVMPLQAKGVTATDADVISDAIANQLQRAGTQRVLERAQMDQILKEQGFQNSGACDGAACAVEVGKLLSVDRMLVGSVGLLGRTYTLSLRLVSVGTGEVIRSSMGDYAGTIDQLLTRLVPETVNDLMDFRDSTNRNAATGKSHWAWWVGGGVVAAGGAAAAVLLLKGSAPASSQGNGPSTTSLTASW